MSSFTIASASPGQTGHVAAVVAGQLRAGDVILLTGGLATGKTTFVQAVARALGSPDTVTSPTFALVHFHTTPVVPVMHVDAYRLSGIHEFRDLGLDDFLEESVTLIEWGDIVAEDFAGQLRIELSCQESAPDSRLLTISSDAPLWQARLESLRGELAQVAVP